MATKFGALSGFSISMRFLALAIALSGLMVFGIEQVVVANGYVSFQENLHRRAANLADGKDKAVVLGAMIMVGGINPIIRETANGTLEPDNQQVTKLLQLLGKSFDFANIRVVNAAGDVVAYYTPQGKSGIGQNKSTTPYYIAAMKGAPCMYPALGRNSGERGFYVSAPIFEKERLINGASIGFGGDLDEATAETPKVIGVVVAKIGFDEVDRLLEHEVDSLAVVSPEGVIFSSNVAAWQYRVLGKNTDLDALANMPRVSQAFEKSAPESLEVNESGWLEHNGHSMKMAEAAIDWKDPLGSWRLIGFADPLKSFGIVQRLAVGAICFAFIMLIGAWWQARALAIKRTLQVKESNRQLKIAMGDLDLRNQFITKTFGRYMSDEVVEKLLESPDGLKLGGETMKVTIVMTDLRGFSAISERLPPEAVVSMLNSYLSIMTDIIFKYSGTINEIIGDAILILFGAPSTRPDDADRAIACALEMQLAMETVNRLNKEHGQPNLEMGIGINTGNVIAGNIGSNMRVKYAVVGSNVNLAGRVESFSVGGQVLIAESTLKATTLNVKVGKEYSVPFKGLADPVNIYDVVGVSGSYEIALPQSEDVFISLPNAIPISFEILDGKHSSGDSLAGHILKLAGKSAIVRCDVELTELSNLKVTVTNIDNVDYVIYTKVMRAISNEQGCYEMRFTFVPAEISTYFDSAVTAPVR
jgi:class 3 adenylate cyclase